MATTTLNSQSLKSRIYLLTLVALFVIPMLLAWFLVGRWQPDSSVQHGELLDPVKPVSQFQARSLTGDHLDESFLTNYWTLLYINAANICEDICRTRLYDMRQIRLALGKDAGRVQTLLIQTEMPDAELETWLLQEHPAMTKAIANTTEIGFFQKAFEIPDDHGLWIYLVDPLGNLVMRYSHTVNSKGILEDLKRLLKYSQIG